MELIVLGAHGTWPNAGGATSGFLVRHDGFTLWMDMGSGTLANLQHHAEIFDVGAAFISHSHPDHVTDLFPYHYARMFSPERPGKIPLLVAPGILERVRPLLSDDTADLPLADTFDVVELDLSQELSVGPFRVRVAPMAHTVATAGLRLEADGAALTYTADTGPTPEVADLARGADILVAEATWQEDGSDHPPIHLTAAQAGDIARRAAAGRLVLGHIRPHLDRARSHEEAAGTFDGEVVVAEEGMTLRAAGR